MNVSTKEINPAFKFAVLAIPGTILFILTVYTDPINLPKLLILIPFTLTALLLFVSLRKYSPQKTSTIEQRLLLLLYLSLGIAMVLIGFLGSKNYIRVLFGADGRNNGLIYYVCVVVLAIIILRVAISFTELEYLDKVLSWTSLLFMAYCVIQFLDLDPASWENPYNRVIGTLGNPNFSASALSCFAVYWQYKFFKSGAQGLSKRFFLLLPAIVMALLSWSTQSLQGLIVFALGSALILYIYARERSASPSIPLVFFLGGGASLLLLFTAFLGFGPFGGSLEQYTLKLRGWYALFGFQAMLKSPWLGVGVDNYISAFRIYRNEEFVSQYGSGLSSNNAHSTPVQIGSSFGLLVFTIYCVIQLLILLRALSVLSTRDTSFSSLKGIALIWILVFSQSLLSIEIIGLGVMNWILGAVILSTSKSQDSTFTSKAKSANRPRKILKYPVWTGTLSIVSLCLGATPAIPISIEDRAFQNLSLYQVSDESSKKFAVENFNKLGKFTLYYPNKLDQIFRNMIDAGLNSEAEVSVKNLYKVEPDNAYAVDLLATFYKNTQQFPLEVAIRKELRNLDPWNEKLELALAQAYSEVRDEDGLRDSISRLKLLNPSGIELQEAQSLMGIFEDRP